MLATVRSRVLSSRLLPRYVKVEIYKTIILLVVLYGCETWSLTLREEHRLRVFENRVIRRIRWARHVARMGEDRKVYKVLVGKPEGKRPLRRPRRRWHDGIRMELTEIGWGTVQWIHLPWGRDPWLTLVNSIGEARHLH
jgi:hypothetical protein